MKYTDAIASLYSYGLSDKYDFYLSNEKMILEETLRHVTPAGESITHDLLTNDFECDHSGYMFAMCEGEGWLEVGRRKVEVIAFAKAFIKAFEIVREEKSNKVKIMTIKLTYTQCKQIAENTDLREFVERLNNIPEWANLDSIAEIQSIIQCGCAANAHISCFYADAHRIWFENTSEIESVLEEYDCSPIEWDITNDTFNMFLSNMLQRAVECICYAFADELNGVDWD